MNQSESVSLKFRAIVCHILLHISESRRKWKIKLKGFELMKNCADDSRIIYSQYVCLPEAALDSEFMDGKGSVLFTLQPGHLVTPDGLSLNAHACTPLGVFHSMS